MPSHYDSVRFLLILSCKYEKFREIVKGKTLNRCNLPLRRAERKRRLFFSCKLLLLLLLLLFAVIGLSPGGSSPTLVRTKIKIQNNKTTTKPLK
jgi:hypothetical protein